MVDDTLALDGGSERTRWQRRHQRADVERAPAKRPIAVHFPVGMFFEIKSQAEVEGLAFTAMTVRLCAEALGARKGK